jgi:hypothetical protein
MSIRSQSVGFSNSGLNNSCHRWSTSSLIDATYLFMVLFIREVRKNLESLITLIPFLDIACMQAASEAGWLAIITTERKNEDPYGEAGLGNVGIALRQW